jgi:gluconolactonase
MRKIVIVTLIASAGVFAQPASLDVQFTLVASGFQFPEGPAWNGKALYVSNCYSDWVARIKDGALDTFVVRPTKPFDFGKTNGLAFASDGSLYACDYGVNAIVKFTRNGACSLVADSWNGAGFDRPNDLAFGADGSLYFSDPKSYSETADDGEVFRITPGGKVERAASGLHFPNGAAVSPDGTRLFLAESAMERVLVFPIGADGSLGDPSEFVSMPGGDPDGMAFDEAGNLYVAHFGGGAVWKIAPSGEPIGLLTTPGAKPSNVAFGGKDMKTLFVTEDETNAVYSVRMETAGAPLFK